MCSHGADFADVRKCSPVSKSLVALRIRSLANGGEHAAQDWGSRGRRFKSCHPDGKQQVRGRFGQNPRRPLCCRVAIGVAMAHILSCPLLLRAAGRQSAPSLETWPDTSPVIATKECSSSSETACSGTPAASMCVAIECLSVCSPTPLTPKSLAAVLIARSALLGSTVVRLSVVKTRPADSALERPKTKDVRRRRLRSTPLMGPVSAAGGAYGNWARPGSSGDRASRGRSADVPLSGPWAVDTNDGICLSGHACTAHKARAVGEDARASDRWHAQADQSLSQR